jgi:hypothetical protein
MQPEAKQSENTPQPRPCLRCRRMLKRPESIARGFGPLCWRREAQDRFYAAIDEAECDLRPSATP